MKYDRFARALEKRNRAFMYHLEHPSLSRTLKRVGWDGVRQIVQWRGRQ